MYTKYGHYAKGLDKLSTFDIKICVRDNFTLVMAMFARI